MKFSVWNGSNKCVHILIVLLSVFCSNMVEKSVHIFVGVKLKEFVAYKWKGVYLMTDYDFNDV